MQKDVVKIWTVPVRSLEKEEGDAHDFFFYHTVSLNWNYYYIAVMSWKLIIINLAVKPNTCKGAAPID